VATTRFHIGAKQLRSTLTAYAKRFDLLEVQMDMVGNGSQTPASQSALRRWRKQVPPHFEFCVVGSSALGRLKPNDVVDTELEDLKRVAFALEARVMLVPTPPEVTPAAVWRDRLARVFDNLPRDANALVWEPHGLWEVEDAAAAARKWGVVLAVDPARDRVPAGPVAYARLRALGETRSFGPSALQRVVDAIGPRRDAYVVLETDGALSECKTLRRIAQKTPAPGEGGRVPVRPRLRVRDDEQE
jgi:uncharacterized protein YecE (DUF72 family)